MEALSEKYCYPDDFQVMDFIGYLKLVKWEKDNAGVIQKVIEDSERFWLDESK